jgi:hypothetical protein
MTTTEGLDQLKAKHAALEAKIDEENKRPLPNDGVIAELKKQKLRIKDQIAELARH